MSVVALNAISVLIARLQRIHPTNGYRTDTGLRVSTIERSTDPQADTLPRITVFSGDEQAEELTMRRYRCRRDIFIEAALQPGAQDDPVEQLEYLIEDIQRAIEQPDTTLGNLVHVLSYQDMQAPEPPQEGGEIGYLRIRYAIEYDRSYGA